MSDQNQDPSSITPIPVRCRFGIHKEVYDFFELVIEHVPAPILAMIVSSKPDDTVDVVDGEFTSYAWWKSHIVMADFLKNINWKSSIGLIRNQGPHQTCWAIVVAELISAIRFIQKLDEEYIDYSPQFMVDFIDKDLASQKYKETLLHYCFPYTLMKGFQFVEKVGLPSEEHWPYVGCRKLPNYRLPRIPHVYISSVVKIPSIEEMFNYLQFHPVGASMPLFRPDYWEIGEGIYRGPMSEGSYFEASHAVSVYGVEEINGKTIALVKSSHGESIGDKGYFKVSLDVLIVEVPGKGKEAHRSFAKPRRLLTRFCFPKF